MEGAWLPWGGGTLMTGLKRGVRSKIPTCAGGAILRAGQRPPDLNTPPALNAHAALFSPDPRRLTRPREQRRGRRYVR